MHRGHFRAIEGKGSGKVNWDQLKTTLSSRRVESFLASFRTEDEQKSMRKRGKSMRTKGQTCCNPDSSLSLRSSNDSSVLCFALD